MKTIKNILKIAVCVTACGMFSGCYELDLSPKTQLSPSTFWKTDEHAKQGIMACYQALKWKETYYRFFGMDCLSDVATGYDDAGYWDISRGTWTSGSEYAQNRWQHTYDGVARVNMTLRNLSEAPGVSDQVRMEVEGEGKFLRALYYFFLLNHFGGVPLYDETFDYNKDYMLMTRPRSTEEQVREFILQDLEAAITNLPVKWDKSDYGRATKGAAYALRGRVYLYNKQYDLARKDFEEIVLDPSGLNYNYSLYPDYAKLFTPEGDESDEMIFAVQNHATNSQSLGMPYAWYMGTNACVGTSWNNVMADVQLVDRYEMKDGRPFNWDEFIPGFTTSKEVREETFIATLSADKKTVAAYPKHYKDLVSMYDQRDPRMRQTIILPYTHYLGILGGIPKDYEYVVASGVTTTNGFVVVNRNYRTYLFRKFVPEGLMDGMITTAQRASIPINFPIIRYADVLLMLAECYNELDRVDDAVKYINMVRQRPSTNLPALNSGEPWLEARTKEEVFDRINQERMVEFPAEGLRYYDLKRWEIIDKVQNGPELDFLGNSVYVNKFEDKNYYWPIPRQEMDRNPNLTQNPGW